MKSTKLLIVLGALTLVTIGASTFAYRGQGKFAFYDGTTVNQYYTPGTNTDSPDFIDEDGDGVCDSYANRPMDGSGQKKGRWY